MKQAEAWKSIINFVDGGIDLNIGGKGRRL